MKLRERDYCGTDTSEEWLRIDGSTKYGNGRHLKEENEDDQQQNGKKE